MTDLKVAIVHDLVPPITLLAQGLTALLNKWGIDLKSADAAAAKNPGNKWTDTDRVIGGFLGIPDPDAGSRPAPSRGFAASDAGAAKLLWFYKNSGLSDAAALGAVAGAAAEGGSLGMAANGAFGIGQWRGARKRALFAKYGHAPTWQQQAAFMLSEIHGGDAGGQSVLEAHSAGGAMVAYLQNFMRPQGAHNEHMQDLINDIRRGRGFLAHNPLAGHSFHINTLQVNTQAKDGKHIARDIHHHLKHHVMVAQADTGGRS